MDPAGPLFDVANPSVRLDRGDAKFVDVIHTDIRLTSLGIVGSFGVSRPIGDVDFYPNGGYHQPGCRDFTIGNILWMECKYCTRCLMIESSLLTITI